MSSKTAITGFVVALVLSGCGSLGQLLSADQNQKRYELKDGSILIVDGDGRMRMFNVYGDPNYMKDGVAMETKDGSVIVMKENVVWKQLRTRGTLNPRG
jgi:hypothetical protein